LSKFVCKNASSCCADAGTDQYERTDITQHSILTIFQKHWHFNHHMVRGTMPVTKNCLWLSFENWQILIWQLLVSTTISLLVISCMHVCMYTSYWGKYCNCLSIAKLNVVKLMKLGTIFFQCHKVYHQPIDDILYLSLEQVYKIFIIHLTVSQRLWNLVPFCNSWCHAPNNSLYWLMLGELCFSILQVLASVHHSTIIWIILTCNIQVTNF
jgi:hypothetical protein